MIRKTKYVIATTLLFTVLLFSSSIAEEIDYKKKFDSLFVLASSGEVQFKEMVAPAIDSIAALGVNAVPFLIDKYETNSARERVTVKNIFKKIGRPAVPLLIEALNRSEGLIVQRVCASLGDIKDSSAVDPLVTISSHLRWQVRDQAVGALGDIKDSRANATVVTAMADSIGQVRKAAAVSSGQLGINSAVEKLVHQLGDDFYGARMSAKHALLKLDTLSVINILRDSLYSENRFVGGIGCELLSSFKTIEAVELLKSVFLDSEGLLKTEAAIRIILAEPENYILNKEFIMTDSLWSNGIDGFSKLKIESAIQTISDGRKEN